MAKAAKKARNAAAKKAVPSAAKKATPSRLRKSASSATQKKSNSTNTGKLLESSLMATLTAASMPAVVGITFTSGIGQITTSLFRNGLLINLQSISSTGSIHFSDVQSGDTISINGVCTGHAEITVSIPTNPQTPERFSAGNINTGYDVS